MKWNYQIVKFERGEKTWYALVQVTKDEDGKEFWWDVDEKDKVAWYKSPEEIIEELEMELKDIKHHLIKEIE